VVVVGKRPVPTYSSSAFRFPSRVSPVVTHPTGRGARAAHRVAATAAVQIVQ